MVGSTHVFLDFFDTLREKGLKVSVHEWLALHEALQSGLVGSSLTRFYFTARSLLVKRESDLDRFDEAFLQAFAGIEGSSAGLVDDVLKWLEDPKGARVLSEAELQALKALNTDALRKLFEQRLREQKERHDGGNRWIGTGGTSPFGNGGTNPAGIRVGGQGGSRSAVHVASDREFQNYRDDLVLDVRQMQVALRKLRRLLRLDARLELDLDDTIDKTSKNAGDLELVMRPPKKNQVKLTLLMDAGGSMTPYAKLVSTLFTAASKAGHWRKFEAYYFHNCVYETVWSDIALRTKVPTSNLLKFVSPEHVLVLVGDATMHPGELFEPYGSIDYWQRNETPGITWLERLKKGFKHSLWLNPMPEPWWNAPSLVAVRRLFRMYPLTLKGLDEAVKAARTGTLG